MAALARRGCSCAAVVNQDKPGWQLGLGLGRPFSHSSSFAVSMKSARCGQGALGAFGQEAERRPKKEMQFVMHYHRRDSFSGLRGERAASKPRKKERRLPGRRREWEPRGFIAGSMFSQDRGSRMHARLEQAVSHERASLGDA
jgi:hypothetical protein